MNFFAKTGAVCALALFAAAGSAQIDSSYSEDFEGLDQSSPTALSDSGWLVGANVFDSTGANFLYNYFAFPAPNGSGAFSNVADGQGGAAQGAQQLVTFNDYGNGDHGNGSGNRIEANFFREWTVGPADVGTWTFTFDAKQGDIAGNSTAAGFIKVLDPGAGFALTDFATADTTAVGTLWNGYSINVDIDAGQVGQLFQIGFLNVASNFEASGVFYDNLNLVPTPGTAGMLCIAGLAATRRRR